MQYPKIDPVAFHLGPIAVHWYGLAYLSGILLGWGYVRFLAGDNELWGDQKHVSQATIDDLPFWLMGGILLGGRIGYALFYEPDHFLNNPTDFLKLWNGGMSFHGGMLGAALAMYIFAHRRQTQMLSLLDLVACAAPIGLFFGRIANFVNGELFGRASTLPWAMVFPDGGPQSRHPSQIYEAMFEGLLLFLTLMISVKNYRSLARSGLTSGLFLVFYGSARIVVEFFREPDAQVGFLMGGLTMGMILSVPMILLGLGLIYYSDDSIPDKDS